MPVYLGVLIHTKTHRRDLVDELYRLGLSISYDRVLSILSELGNNICRYFLLEGAVSPPKLKGGLFTTGAVDNIDHNPSSTSAHDSFCDDGNDLLVLNSRDLADPAVINTVHQIEKLGQEQYHTYVSERLVNQAKAITAPVRRNNLPLFSRSPVREKSRTQLQLSSLKNDCCLFSRLFIASQMRDGDLDDFFAHENQACPLPCHRWAK